MIPGLRAGSMMIVGLTLYVTQPLFLARKGLFGGHGLVDHTG